MTDIDPLSQLAVEQQIMELVRAAHRVTVEVGQRARAAAEADAAYKVKRAKEFLRAEGSVAVREAHAEVACADEYLAKKTTEALLLSAKEAGLNVRARLDAMRTLASNVRSAVANPTGRGA